MSGLERLETQLVDCLRRALAGGKPIVPEAGRLLWSLFVELSAARSGTGFGPNPISHCEIEAWARLNRWPLRPHHVAILRAMDRAWLERIAEKAGTKAGTYIPAGAQPITADAFDAVFG